MGVTDLADRATAAFDYFTQPNAWVRMAKFFGGGLMILVGVILIGANKALPVVQGVTGAATKVAKVVK